MGEWVNELVGEFVCECMIKYIQSEQVSSWVAVGKGKGHLEP